jgi:predicted deacylase
MHDNPIAPNVDFNADGVQHGFLKLPYSHNASAWGSIMIPITVAKNDEGPTVLFTGANHAVDVVEKFEHKLNKPVVTDVLAIFAPGWI